MQGFLAGVRIIDMSSILMGPYCTMTLADLGADVIKIEPPEGDLFRDAGKPAKTKGMGPLHMTLGRGKRSVVLDLKLAEDRTVMERLLETADVFIHNVRAPAIERLGFGYEAVRKIKPDIIYVHCTGFSSQGPYAELPAYDDVIQAAAGLTTLLPRVEVGTEPRYLPTALADKVSGLHAAYATLAALFHKQRTQLGQRVEVSMLEAVTAFTLAEHLYGHVFVPHNGPTGYSRILVPTRRPFPTSDGYISLLPYTDANWIAFFTLSGHPNILQDPRFDSYRNRLKNIEELYRIVGEITPERTTDAWLQLLKPVNIPMMRVNDLDNITSDPHLSAIGFFRTREHPSEGPYIEAAAPVAFSGAPVVDATPAPLLGEHTEEILRELGFPAR
jgi:crotonobetainyl-CoA:carnitine CoA-transferase CaiB-like acyl-CoA transferase